MRSLEEALSEVERELNVRKRCYDRWVQDGKMTTVDARDRLERLQAAFHYLKQVVDDVRHEEMLPHAAVGVTSSGDMTGSGPAQ